jgi:hypothetical protein
MDRKRKRRRSTNSEELDRRFEETSRLLEQRIAYHRALIARESARRPPASDCDPPPEAGFAGREAYVERKDEEAE